MCQFPLSLQRINRQIDLWRSLQHPNILRLYGIVQLDNTTNAPIYFVSPWIKVNAIPDNSVLGTHHTDLVKLRTETQYPIARPIPKPTDLSLYVLFCRPVVQPPGLISPL